MRAVLFAWRAILAELELGLQDWSSVILEIASALNEASIDRFGRRPDGPARSPLQVMTGMVHKRRLLRVLPAEANHASAKTIDRARALQLIGIEELQKTLEEVHKDVRHAVSLRCERAIAAHNKAPNIISLFFTVGDFFLVRRAIDCGHKLQFRWFGPCRVTSVHGDLVYGVTPLRGGKTGRFYCARLLKYRDTLLGKLFRKIYSIWPSGPSIATKSSKRLSTSAKTAIEYSSATNGMAYRTSETPLGSL